MANEKRLIDANALIKDIDNYYHNSPFPHPGTTWLRGLELAVGLLLKAPTVDVAPVVHGRWEIVDFAGSIRCSVCGQIMDQDFNYCPNCGAKMDGDGNGK